MPVLITIVKSDLMTATRDCNLKISWAVFLLLELLSSDYLPSHRFGDPIELPCDRIHIPTILLGLVHHVPAPIPVLLLRRSLFQVGWLPGCRPELPVIFPLSSLFTFLLKPVSLKWTVWEMLKETQLRECGCERMIKSSDLMTALWTGNTLWGTYIMLFVFMSPAPQCILMAKRTEQSSWAFYG